MVNILIINIKELFGTESNPRMWVAGKDMAEIGSITNAYLFINNGLIADFGKMDQQKVKGVIQTNPDTRIIDASGKLVFPSFCDSHTHLVYPASREVEYVDKIKGLSYEEIARRGGGILNSAARMQHVSRR